jgi:hypothetical protein
MKIMKKVKLAVVAVLVIGTMAIESKAQDRGFGVMVGGEIGRGYGATRAAVFFPPPPPLPSIVFSYNDRDHHRDEYRPHHRFSQVCWEEGVRIERRHGGYRDVTRTVCRDKDWRGHHGGWRDHDRGWRDDDRSRDRW